MKRTFLFIVICLLVNISYSQTYTFTFSTSDFSIVENEGKHMIDYPAGFNAICTTCDPILPSCVKNIVLPPNKKVSNYTITYATTSWCSNIILEAMPVACPTDGSDCPNIPCIYDLKVYPDSIVRYGGLSTIDRYPYISFVITPFVYDATNGSLSFVYQVNITLELADDNVTNEVYPTQDRVIKRIVHNPSDVDLFYPKRSQNRSSTQNIDYLIITADSLKSSFEPLRIWKTQKGVYTKIVTIEEIDATYNGSTQYLRIKRCVQDYSDNYGLKWLLLGGDDVIIPSVKIPMSISETHADIPADIFYSCFDGDFNWNANKNDIIGEFSDDAILNQVLNISRLPMNTAQQIDTYVNKLLRYEQHPTTNNPSMLFCARIIVNDEEQTYQPQTGFSDGHIKSDILIQNSISPYKEENIYRFYDTYTDFAGGANYNLNIENFTTQLNNNYNFLHFATHGDSVCFALENGAYYYTTEVSNLTNTVPMIIATLACSTNAFDKIDPCLSEAFIRKSVGGAIAYLGCSRQGWASYGFTNMGPSFSFDASFYEILFSGKSNHFAEAVNLTKQSYVSEWQNHMYYRWIILGNNAMGDAELPIYTTIPNQFENVSFERNGKNLMVNTGGVDSCTITVSDVANGGNYYATYTDVSTATFTDVPGSCTIVITKDNYIPYVITPECLITTEIINNTRIVTGCEETQIGGLQFVDPGLEDMEANDNTRSMIDSLPNNSVPVGHVRITSTGSLEVINGGNVVIKELSMEEGAELKIH